MKEDNMTQNNLQNSVPPFLILLTIDGWDVGWKQHPILKQAETPNLNELISDYPCTALDLTRNQEALKKRREWSEIGYYEIGTGKDFFTPLHFIDNAIKNKTFFKNKTLLKAVDHVQKNNSQLHLLGLASDASFHSSLEHLENLLILAKQRGLSRVYIHLILDGVDAANNKGSKFLKQVEGFISKHGIGEIATIHGRIYAMDRNNQWGRVAKSYRALVNGEGNYAEDAEKSIQRSYKKEIYDQEFPPTVITKDKKPVSKVKAGDSLIFFNVEGDRARELTKAFVMPGWDKFPDREYIDDLFFVCFTGYEKNLPVKIAFPRIQPILTLSEVLEDQGWGQLKISGSRKYSHLNHFFNGERILDLKKETQELITSDKGEEIKKEREITSQIGEEMIRHVKNKTYKFSLVNLANFDFNIINKNKNREQLFEYIEEVDNLLGKITKNVVNKDGVLIITSTTNSLPLKNKNSRAVPLLMIRNNWKGKNLGWEQAPRDELNLLQPLGDLKDLHPTILKILNLNYSSKKGKPLF